MLTALILTATITSHVPFLPPAPPFQGASRALIVPATDPWITPAEKTQLRTTPRYEETIAYLRRLVAAAPQLRMVSIGKTEEGREMWMVIASKERAFTPDALKRTGKPIFFAQAGIHAGEIDGKDAGLMLLRDMTVRGTKKELLDGASFLFVPIFNIDGHERFSAFTRVNQRGPEEGGWRTTARNYNLNRDYIKADTAEMRAMLRALQQWQPDLYADLHVTDGADYQYDVTYGWNETWGYSPSIAAWLNSQFRSDVDRALASMGHVPGPFIFNDDPFKGIANANSDPRLSHGYGDLRHLPTVLVETHSLKPYDQRVLGTYVFLEQALRTLARDGASLRRATAEDRARRAATVPFSWRVPQGQNETIELRLIESRRALSPITGDVRIEWTGKPVTVRVPYRIANEVATSAPRPKAYWIPAAWAEVIGGYLDLHGVPYERINAPREIEVTMDRLSDVKFANAQFEGRVRVTATATPERHRETFPAGSLRVSTDQPLGDLAMVLLEPASQDSLFQWGVFNAILAPTEYVEPYIMEPMAERMLTDDPKLAEEFRQKVESDPEFRGRARLQWLYQHTPFYDERARLYPVGRE